MFIRKLLLVKISSVLLIIGLSASLSFSPAAATAQTLTFKAEADSFVNVIHPGTNYGKKINLRLDHSPILNSYIRFTVSGTSGVPKQVRLLVYAKSASPQGLIVNSVADNTWGEGKIDYRNAPAMGGSLAVSPAIIAANWVSLDVTGYVTGNGTYSFGISTSGSPGLKIAARESGTKGPKLILNYDGSPSPVPSTIKHVFEVVMENHSYSQVWNTSSSPYITSLGNTYARATNYHAITHPSLPNYLDIFGGSNYGITTDCIPSSSCHVNATNLADNLQAVGLIWRGYMESMPSPCYLSNSGGYAPKHDPFVYFDDIRTDSVRCNAGVVPFSALANDLKTAATTPNYAFITPNLCNDMHDCSISSGDTWLKNNLPAILASPACTSETCLLIVTWDEDNGSQGNQVLTIFAGSGAKTGGVTSSVSYTHFSLLRTIEDIFGLPTQSSSDAAASPMSDLLR